MVKSSTQQKAQWLALLAGAAARLLLAAGAAGAQTTEMAASDVVARIVAGDPVELRGALLHGDLTLPRSTRVIAPFRCRECHLTGSFRAPDALFAKGLDLERSVIDGGIDMSRASFDDWAIFDGSRVVGSTLLGGARFAEALSAREARFGGPLSLDRARVNGPVSFARADFRDKGIFTGTEFGARADFGQSHYAAEARFEDVVFSGSPTFSLGEFASRASFERAEFRAGGNFQFARFADVSLDRAVAAGRLSFDEAVIDGEASLDGLTSSGEVSLDGIRAGRHSLFVEQLSVERVSMDVDVVPAIRGRAAQLKMLRRLELTAKARGDLSTANDARFHRLSMKGEDKDGLARMVDDANRVLAGYLVRPVRPIASFLGLLAAASLVRLGFMTFLGGRKAASDSDVAVDVKQPAGDGSRGAAVEVPANERGRGQITDLLKAVWKFSVFLWKAFWKAVADAFESLSRSLSVAFRVHAGVAKPQPGRPWSYPMAVVGWVEFVSYKLMLAVMVLTIGNANATVRELLESVRP